MIDDGFKAGNKLGISGLIGRSVLTLPTYDSSYRKPLEGVMVGKLDEYLRFNETALNLRAKRQEVIASNIANADTPNYKARDFDFNNALQGALARSVNSTSPTEMVRTVKAHLDAAAKDTVGGAPLQFRNIAQGSVDGNTVDMDVERNQFMDNAIRYEAGLTLMSDQIKKMLTALQG